MSTSSRRERAQLVATLHAVGPEAPTLCEGWTKRDLAAHLMVRERRLDAMVGVAFGPMAGYTVYSPLKVLDPLANGFEMFIQHEDVRRATPAGFRATSTPRPSQRDGARSR